MKKKPEQGGEEVREMRSEYDFSAGVRGKYAEKAAEGTNVVVLDPDIARAFPSSRAVNEALRQVLCRRDEESR